MCCSCCPWAQSGAIFLVQVCQEQRDQSGMFAGLCLPDSQLCPGRAAPNSWSKTKTKPKLCGTIFLYHITSTVAATKPCRYTTEQIVGCAAAIPLTACKVNLTSSCTSRSLAKLPSTDLPKSLVHMAKWTGIPKCCKLGCSKCFLINR